MPVNRQLTTTQTADGSWAGLNSLGFKQNYHEYCSVSQNLTLETEACLFASLSEPANLNENIQSCWAGWPHFTITLLSLLRLKGCCCLSSCGPSLVKQVPQKKGEVASPHAEILFPQIRAAIVKSCMWVKMPSVVFFIVFETRTSLHRMSLQALRTHWCSWAAQPRSYCLPH